MLAEMRFAAILKELTKNKSASVGRLCELTGASEATIRRDINALAKQGKIGKVYGGAVLKENVFQVDEPDVSTKSRLHQEEKELIAGYAAKLINDDDVVFIDAGTTTVKMIDSLKESKAVFATNGIDCAKKLMDAGLISYILGGILKHGTGAIVGALTLRELEKFNFTKAFLGINGISEPQGFTTPDTEEAAVKTKAAEQSYLTYILADSSKFSKVSAATVLPLEKATVITDFLPDKSYLEHTIIKEVKP